MPISLILADDHPLILDALEALFRLEEDFEVMARCRDGVETIRTVKERQPDVLVLDIKMPGKDGLQVACEMKAEKTRTRIVLLTGEIDEMQVADAVRMGVRGIVLKEMAPKLLVKCIREVHDGKLWIERYLEGQALEKVLRRETGVQEVTSTLTASEINVVRLVSGGLRNKEIAEKLFISEGTVKVHLHNTYEKLGINGRMALLRYAQEKGIV